MYTMYLIHTHMYIFMLRGMHACMLARSVPQGLIARRIECLTSYAWLGGAYPGKLTKPHNKGRILCNVSIYNIYTIYMWLLYDEYVYTWELTDDSKLTQWQAMTLVTKIGDLAIKIRTEKSSYTDYIPLCK